MQVSFIDIICLPLYKMMSDTFPWIKPLYNGTLDNRNHWQDLAEQVEMGLVRLWCFMACVCVCVPINQYGLKLTRVRVFVVVVGLPLRL